MIIKKQLVQNLFIKIFLINFVLVIGYYYISIYLLCLFLQKK